MPLFRGKLLSNQDVPDIKSAGNKNIIDMDDTKLSNEGKIYHCV
jgi:hypothetical protein